MQVTCSRNESHVAQAIQVTLWRSLDVSVSDSSDDGERIDGINVLTDEDKAVV